MKEKIGLALGRYFVLVLEIFASHDGDKYRVSKRNTDASSWKVEWNLRAVEDSAGKGQ
jgi:hypothetical protein